MTDSVIILSEEEQMSSGVVKMTNQLNNNLNEENGVLKKSLKELQDGFEELREKFNKSETNNKLLRQDKKFLESKIQDIEKQIKAGKILDIIFAFLSIGIAIFVNLITNDLRNIPYWIMLIILVIVNIGIIIYKSK